MEEVVTVKEDLGIRNYSILIPIYNGCNYLDSLRRQLMSISPEGIEFVIVNDGSTDIHEKDFVEFFNLLQNCKIVTKHHTGLVESLNIGIKNCAYEFVARFDVDDEFISERFVMQHEYLSKNGECSAVFCDYEILSSKGRTLGVLPSAVFPDLVKLSLINPQRTPHPGVMFRKSKVLAAGGYRHEEFPAEDLGLWIRLLEFGSLGSIPSVLLRYKMNSTGISSTKRLEMKLKTIQLLKAFSISISSEEFISNTMHSFSGYKEYSHRGIREALALRDLLKLLYFGKFNLGFKLKTFLKILCKLLRLRLIVSCVLLLIEALKRQAIRKGFISK